MTSDARDLVDAFLEDLRQRHQASAISWATLRQRVTFLGDLLAFAEQTHVGGDGPVPARALFDPNTSQAWIDAVAQGHRRQRATAAGNPRASTATIRAATASLRAFAQWADTTLETSRQSRQAPRPHLDPEALHQRCTALLDGPRPQQVTPALWLRTRALIRVVIDTGARVGEITDMTTHDLADDLARIHTAPNPPGPGPTPPPHIARLDPRTRVALDTWTTERAHLTARLEGGPVHALWVTTVPHRARGPLRPAGLPIGARALEGAWARVRLALSEATGHHQGPMAPPRLLTDWRPPPPH